MAPPVFDKDLYIVFSALDSKKSITWYPVPVPLPGGPKPVEVEVWGKTIQGTGQPKWRFVPGPPGSNLYTITLAGEDAYHLAVKGGLLWATTEGKPTLFSIESEGNNKYRFHIPDKDEVLRLDAPETQVKTAPQDGTDNEHWYIDEWHHA